MNKTNSENYEKGCKWFFVPVAKNAMAQGFQGFEQLFKNDRKGKETVFCREVIQNSLDARLDKSKPVHLKFSFHVLDQENHPNFFGLSEHIEACNNGDANDVELCKDLQSVIQNKNGISYLQVSDYNTTGLINDTIRRVVYSMGNGKGRSKDEKDMGGSYGFGHNAYIGLSSIKTFLISSYDKDGKWSFSGLVSLKSHVFNEQAVSSYGYYTSDNEGSAVYSQDAIPRTFRRNIEEGYGTDLFIMGCNESDDFNKKMIIAILENFWLAIYRNRLSIEIEGTEESVFISRDNLDELLKHYFSEKDTTDNPLPYYQAITHLEDPKNKDKRYFYFEKELDLLGTVKLYVNTNNADRLNKKVEYMRSPLMLIRNHRLGNNFHYNFSAIFICDSTEGNDVLRQMETATHDYWNLENIKGAKTLHEKYKNVLNDIDSFIRESVDGIFNDPDVDVIHIDLGNLLNPFFSSQTNDITSNKGKQKGKVTENKKPVKTKIKQQVSSGAFKDLKGSASGNDGGDYTTGKGRHKTIHPGGHPAAGLGQTHSKYDPNGKGRVGKSMDIEYDVIAVEINGTLLHRFFLLPKETYDNCFIYVSIGTDNTTDKDVNILKAVNKGTDLKIDGNCIKHIPFQKGVKSIIDVQLNDNLKHTIKLNTLKDE